MAKRRCLNAQHDFYLNGTLVLSWNTPFNPASPGWPRLDIDPQKGVGNWRGHTDYDEVEPQEMGGRRGELPYKKTPRGKTLTYNLLARTTGEDDLDEMLENVDNQLQDHSTMGLLVVTPWDDSVDDSIWSTFASVVDFDCDELQSRGKGSVPSPWVRDAILSIRQVDGVWLWINESGTPFVPVSWSGGSSVDVTNGGRTDVDLVVTVEGVEDGDDLHIGRTIDLTHSEDLWFRNPVGLAGETGAHDVVVDFGQHPRRVTVEGIDVVDSYDASSSSWWDEFVPGVPPGTHTIWHGPGAGTGIAVHFFSGSK